MLQMYYYMPSMASQLEMMLHGLGTADIHSKLSRYDLDPCPFQGYFAHLTLRSWNWFTKKTLVGNHQRSWLRDFDVLLFNLIYFFFLLKSQRNKYSTGISEQEMPNVHPASSYVVLNKVTNRRFQRKLQHYKRFLKGAVSWDFWPSVFSPIDYT
jgi:hypothetical protein